MSITKFKYDVFISYSRLDNQGVFGTGAGFVDQFVAHLEQLLAMRYGEANAVSIWRDSKVSPSENFNEVIEHAVRSAALFLAFLSPSYLRSETNNRELRAFVQTAQSSSAGLFVKNRSRVLPILLYAVPHETWPVELRDLMGFSLFSLRHERDVPLTPDDVAYRQAVVQIADVVLRSLRDLAGISEGDASRESGRGTPIPGEHPHVPEAQEKDAFIDHAPQDSSTTTALPRSEPRQVDREVHEHDIFISYARENSRTAEALARRLEGENWRVFWDRSIPIGQTWVQILETKLDAVSSVVVLWSKASVASQWVLLEASEGLEQAKLLPVFIENVRAPLQFRRLQGAELVGWDHRTDTPDLHRLVEAIRRLVKRSARSP